MFNAHTANIYLQLFPIGSLLNLAKHPASTVQILGAEKALFRALKTKKDTPKYGLIYHASLVSQCSAKNKVKSSNIFLHLWLKKYNCCSLEFNTFSSQISTDLR